MKSIFRFFDKLEDRIRGWLSRRPILYGIIGGVGVVLFWRGVWHTNDFLFALFLNWRTGVSVDFNYLPDGPISLALGTILLLMTGLFVSDFIGTEVMMSGLRGEKKISEKTEEELETEASRMTRMQTELGVIKKELDGLYRLEKKKQKRKLLIK